MAPEESLLFGEVLNAPAPVHSNPRASGRNGNSEAPARRGHWAFPESGEDPSLEGLRILKLWRVLVNIRGMTESL